MEIRRISNDELYHHGIKGQKWGVRRYQNPDGTLTAAGKKRYYKDEYGIHLTSKGQKMADKYSKKAGHESRNIAKKVIKNNTELYNEYLNLKDKSYKFGEDERQKWLEGKDYKNMDYYQFKDASAEKYINTVGKRQMEVQRRLLEKAKNSTSKALNKLYDKPLNEIEQRYSFGKSYGQDISNRAYNMLLRPSSELKTYHKTKYKKPHDITATTIDGDVFKVYNASPEYIKKLKRDKRITDISDVNGISKRVNPMESQDSKMKRFKREAEKSRRRSI